MYMYVCVCIYIYIYVCAHTFEAAVRKDADQQPPLRPGGLRRGRLITS